MHLAGWWVRRELVLAILIRSSQFEILPMSDQFQSGQFEVSLETRKLAVVAGELEPAQMWVEFELDPSAIFRVPIFSIQKFP